MDYIEQWNANRVDWLYQLARCRELGAPAVRIGLLFGTFFQADTREELKPGHEWLMENGRMSKPTVVKAVAELEREGFLIVEGMRRYRNLYSMPFDGDGPWKREPLGKKSCPY